MKKNHLLLKAAALAMSAALAMPTTVLAAPAAYAPVEISVPQDGKTHKVFVFGTSLALVSPDGSTEISTMGPVGRVDVMIDGNLTKNVASINIPAKQLGKMVLDKGSVVVKNVSAETSEAVKKQINDAYAAGADSVDLASLANVTAYKVNENGTLTNTAGKTVSSKEIGMTVSSVEATSTAFTEEIHDIVTRETEESAEKIAAKAAPAPQIQEEEEISSRPSVVNEKPKAPSKPSKPSKPDNGDNGGDDNGGDDNGGDDNGGDDNGGGDTSGGDK